MTSSPLHHASLFRLRAFSFLRRLLCRNSIIFPLLVLNVLFLLWFYSFRRRLEENEAVSEQSATAPSSPKSSNDVTVIVREFEDFDNAVSATISSILHILPGAPILIIVDKLPHPPLNIPSSHSIRIVTLNNLPRNNYFSNHLEHVIETPFVLFLPDGAMITRRDHVLNFLVGTMKRRRSTSVDVIAVGLSSQLGELTCVNMTFNAQEWTLTKVGEGLPLSHPHDCRGGAVSEVDGSVALFMRTSLLWNISHPFARPFPHSFYAQSSLRGFSIRLETRFKFGVSRALFSDAHNRWKHKTLERERKKDLYKAIGIKKVVHKRHEGDHSPSVEWFGCTRESSRCFPSVGLDENPAYINEGRWTPPCCLEKLRETTRHVVEQLEKTKVRYWLEGGSLLGALRHGDIIPWDYDVDLGIYRSDFSKCKPLQLAWETGAYEDEKGFIWERAREADFIRVQFSRSNHLHVDLFPFYPDEKGVMTKDFWFETHRQDTEFPERFLTPTTRVPFAGIQVAAPNHARDFLELKFGPGVIETPRYPKGPPMELLVRGKERPLLNGV